MKIQSRRLERGQDTIINAALSLVESRKDNSGALQWVFSCGSTLHGKNGHHEQVPLSVPATKDGGK